jgi:hypothetical protein
MALLYHSACDALQKSISRLAARANLQHSYTDQLMTPRQLFHWAQTNIQNMNSKSVTELGFYLKEIQQLNQYMEHLPFMLFCQHEKVH